MKKLIIFFIVIFLFAEIKGLGELLRYIFPLVTHKKVVKVYTLPKYYKYFYSGDFVLVKDCEKSDIVFGDVKCYNKPTFTLNYYFYKHYKNAFGVFYYRKGRPQLKFKREILIKFFKKVPNELKDYVE